jgi:hypothetical protein
MATANSPEGLRGARDHKESRRLVYRDGSGVHHPWDYGLLWSPETRQVFLFRAHPELPPFDSHRDDILGWRRCSFEHPTRDADSFRFILLLPLPLSPFRDSVIDCSPNQFGN